MGWRVIRCPVCEGAGWRGICCPVCVCGGEALLPCVGCGVEVALLPLGGWGGALFRGGGGRGGSVALCVSQVRGCVTVNGPR